MNTIKHWNRLPGECSPFGVSVLGDTTLGTQPWAICSSWPCTGQGPGLDGIPDTSSKSVTELGALISCTRQSPAEEQTHVPSITCFPELYPPLLPLRRPFTRDRRALRAASTMASLVLPPAVKQNKNKKVIKPSKGQFKICSWLNYKLNPPSP